MVTPADVTWSVAISSETSLLKELHDLDAPHYESAKHAIRDFFCRYVSAEPACLRPNPGSISPMGATEDGGKILKMRWPYGGSGKREGLRLILVAYCANREVVVTSAELRKNL
jgi:hypothetical protein